MIRYLRLKDTGTAHRIDVYPGTLWQRYITRCEALQEMLEG